MYTWRAWWLGCEAPCCIRKRNFVSFQKFRMQNVFGVLAVCLRPVDELQRPAMKSWQLVQFKKLARSTGKNKERGRAEKIHFSKRTERILHWKPPGSESNLQPSCCDFVVQVTTNHAKKSFCDQRQRQESLLLLSGTQMYFSTSYIRVCGIYDVEKKA